MEVRNNFIIRRREEEAALQQVADAIEGALMDSELAGAGDARVELVMTTQGLRIEMMEGVEGEIYFDKSSAQLKPERRRWSAYRRGSRVRPHHRGRAHAREGWSRVLR